MKTRRKIVLALIIFCILLVICAVLFIPRFFSNSSFSTVEDACQFVINNNEMYRPSCTGKNFRLFSRDVQFVQVTYGIEHAMSDATFIPSSFCAIVDRGEIYPYRFSFLNEEDFIIDVKNSNNEKCSVGEQCKEVLTAQNHKLTQKDSFKRFKENEMIPLCR